MRWGWGLFLGLLGLALLLGFPPLLKGAVEGGLALLGFRGAEFSALMWESSGMEMSILALRPM